MLRKTLVSLSVLISSCSTLVVPAADTSDKVYYLDLEKKILYNYEQSVPFDEVPDKMYCAEMEFWLELERILAAKKL